MPAHDPGFARRLTGWLLRLLLGVLILVPGLVALFDAPLPFWGWLFAALLLGAGLGFPLRHHPRAALAGAIAYGAAALGFACWLGAVGVPVPGFWAFYALVALFMAGAHQLGAARSGAGWLAFELVLAAGLLLGRHGPPPGVPVPGRPRLYVGPRFLTGDRARPVATAVVTDAGGKILVVLDTIPRDTAAYEVHHLPGALGVPGLTDAHLHLNLLALLRGGVDLTGVGSRAELRDRLAAFIAAHPGRSAYLGSGWDQERFSDHGYPTAADLDGLTDRPVFLLRVDQHAVLVNRQVLARAGITPATPDPPAGRIERDSAGAPSGVLVDAALQQAQAALPEFGVAEWREMVAVAVTEVAGAGLVAAHDMALDSTTWGALAALDSAAPLPVRVFGYIRGDQVGWLLAHRLRRPWAVDEAWRRQGRVELMGIKLVLDGAMGSSGALLFQDYSDQPGHRGAPAYDLTLQRRAYQLAQLLGLQVAIHAIGDSANAVALDWIERGHRGSLPTRIEHAQVVRPTDFPRFGRPSVAASMQPIHLVDDLPWTLRRLGSARAEGAYAWRRMLDAGATLAFGSDAPVASVKPQLGIAAALTRADTLGQPPGGFFPAERLHLAEILDAYARAPFDIVGHPGDGGLLAPGRHFAVTLFAADCGEDAACWVHDSVAGRAGVE